MCWLCGTNCNTFKMTMDVRCMHMVVLNLCYMLTSAVWRKHCRNICTFGQFLLTSYLYCFIVDDRLRDEAVGEVAELAHQIRARGCLPRAASLQLLRACTRIANLHWCTLALWHLDCMVHTNTMRYTSGLRHLDVCGLQVYSQLHICSIQVSSYVNQDLTYNQMCVCTKTTNAHHMQGSFKSS